MWNRLKKLGFRDHLAPADVKEAFRLALNDAPGINALSLFLKVQMITDCCGAS